MVRINHLLVLITFFLVSCQTGSSEESVSPENRIAGSWVDEKYTSSAPEIFVFLPNGTFEGENMGNEARGEWSLSSDFLTIRVTDESTLDYQWRFDDNYLELKKGSSVRRLIRRPYGLNVTHVKNRINHLTRQVDVKLSRIQETTREVPVESEPGKIIVMGLWMENQLPLKLAVTRPSLPGEFTGFTEYYFLDGFLIFFIGSESNYAFEDNLIVAQWNEEGVFQEMNKGSIKETSSNILNELRTYLKQYQIIESGKQFKKAIAPEVSEPSS